VDEQAQPPSGLRNRELVEFLRQPDDDMQTCGSPTDPKFGQQLCQRL
jgi:hypothetical protein